MAFEHKTETEARQQILDMVAEYCDTYHIHFFKIFGRTGGALYLGV